MGGDLNLKKSWHPVLMSNQRRVWEEEKKALDERKRIEQMMKERQEERQIQELQEMQEAAGGKKRLNRVDWMYSGPAAGQAGTTEEMEGYLLGKRRIDGLIKGTENKKLEKAASEDSFIALQKANTIRDTASKIREDPMLAIKKQEQAAYEALMNDPEETKQVQRKTASIANTTIATSMIESTAAALSAGGWTKMTDPTQEAGAATEEIPSHRLIRDPPHPTTEDHHLHTDDGADLRLHIIVDDPIRHHVGGQSPHTNDDGHLHPTERSDDQALKLAAMQENASELERDRERRIAAIAEQENAEMQADEAARNRSTKYGGKGEFVHGLNRKAGDLDIGERMRRGRQGLGREGRDDD
ncbi:MAG: hypothetical protein LQ350_006249 [Teloschistes chrysophthalmus]|nr:MAG: hypothetical protein LQ350_006249 [Niorma chrysophthalma]